MLALGLLFLRNAFQRRQKFLLVGEYLYTSRPDIILGLLQILLPVWSPEVGRIFIGCWYCLQHRFHTCIFCSSIVPILPSRDHTMPPLDPSVPSAAGPANRAASSLP